MAYVEPTRGGFKVRWREGGRGSRLLTSRVFTSRDAADDYALRVAERLAARSRLGSIAPRLGLGEVLERWLRSRLAERRVTPAGGAEIVRLLRHLARARGWTSTGDITPAEVDRWRGDNGGRNARVGAYLRAVLRWAGERIGQDVDPAALVALRPPKAARRPRPDLPAAQLVATWRRQAARQSPHAEALVHCLASYGWRPVTAARMRVADVDLARGTVRLRGLKGTGDDLVHPLLPETVRLLRALCAGRRGDDALFLDPRTGRAFQERARHRGSITGWWRATIDSGVGRGVYQVKRLAISNLLALGIAPQDVALFTGHRTLSQVLTYARTNEERAREALRTMGARRVHAAGSGRAKPRRRSAKPREMRGTA